MRCSVLHLSDLHRDLTDEIGNRPLIESLVRDFERFEAQDPKLITPSLAVVTGDLVYGAGRDAEDPITEVRRQYDQAEEFLVDLAGRFFGGNHDRIVLLPGNHDVCYADVLASATPLPIPTNANEKTRLVTEYRMPKTRLRWSWDDMCFYRIVDEDRYRRRLEAFADMYARFYRGQRSFDLTPAKQSGVFDYPDLGLTIVALNSCFENDPLRRIGSFHPDCIAEMSRLVRRPQYAGRLFVAAWHHSPFGSPNQDDNLSAHVLQVLIDAGVSIGLHGHQHFTQCVDERYRLGTQGRKITVISAGSLSTGPKGLSPGEPRSYNIVEVNTDGWLGRVHQRRMVNLDFVQPIWNAGHFDETQTSYVEFGICPPSTKRPAHLDERLALEKGEDLVRQSLWSEAVDVLATLQGNPLARLLLVKALAEMEDPQLTLRLLWPPTLVSEMVLVGAAILDGGTPEQALAFLSLDTVTGSSDASVHEIVRKLERRAR